MRYISREEIDAMAQRYRGRFINSLSGFKSVNLVGSKSKAGQENLSVVSSVVHLGSHPALLGMVMRPPSVPRHTYENILETGTYTLNHVSQEMAKQAHQTSARYTRDESESDAVDLPLTYRPDFHAPWVKSSPLSMGMELVEDVHIRHNDTRLIIGSVAWVQVNEQLIAADGYVNLELANVVSLSGLDSYHSTKRLYRLSYAKPGKPVEELQDIMTGFDV